MRLIQPHEQLYMERNSGEVKFAGKVDFVNYGQWPELIQNQSTADNPIFIIEPDKQTVNNEFIWRYPKIL